MTLFIPQIFKPNSIQANSNSNIRDENITSHLDQLSVGKKTNKTETILAIFRSFKQPSDT